MKPEIKRQMTGWDFSKGDRSDAVAVALRRFHLRVELCPCMGEGGSESCKQCQLDLESIEQAWLMSEPKS